jgi:integrase
MAKSITITFIKQSPREQYGTVYLRTIENRIIKKKSIGVKITQKQWNDYFNPNTNKFRVDKNFPKHEILNLKIDEILSEINKYSNDLDAMPDNKKSFIDYWQELINNKLNHGTKIKNQVIIDKIKKFLHSIHKEDILFKDITPIFLERLKKYLLTTEDPKKLSINTTTHYLKVFQSVINRAKKTNYYAYLKNPFDSIVFEHVKIQKDVLSEAEVDNLFKEIDGAELNHNRDMFLFQVFSNGMRVSDVLLLRWNNFKNDRLEYVMFKTGTPISIPININMCFILSRILGVFDDYKKIIDLKKYNLSDDKKIVNLVSIEDIDKMIANKMNLKFYKLPKNRRLISNSNEEKYGKTKYKGFEIWDDDETKNLIDTRENLLRLVNRVFMDKVQKLIEKKKENASSEFVFKHLPNEMFNNINDKNIFRQKISKEQYVKIKHHTIVYNRKLKEIQKSCGIKTNISSHVSRHTFTNLLLRMDNVNLYDISQSLGHSSIKITENYLASGFNTEKTDYLSNNLSDRFSFKK